MVMEFKQCFNCRNNAKRNSAFCGPCEEGNVRARMIEHLRYRIEGDSGESRIDAIAEAVVILLGDMT